MVRYEHKIAHSSGSGYMSRVSSQTVDVAKYGSLTELTNAVREKHDHYSGNSWSGRGTLAQSCDMLLRGVSERETQNAKELIARINTKVENRQRFERIPSVYGASVRIGAFLRDEPNDMMRRKRLISDVAPVRIVIENTVSAGVNQSELALRGAACAALVQALCNIRPTEMWVSWGLGDHHSHSSIGMAKISTTPANLAQLVAALATENSARKIAFTEIHEVRGRGYGGWAIGQPESDVRNQHYREALRLNEKDIFIPGGHFRESKMMTQDPVRWVNKYLDAQR